MRVLILTQHFAPEVTAGRFRLEAFAEALAMRHHDVHVLCPVPNHPRGEIEAGYRGRAVIRRRMGPLRVTYLHVLTAREKTLLTRLGYYGSYASFASVAGAVAGKPDVILASSPPLTVAAAGVVLSIRHRAPLVVDIRDLWPESAVALGELEPDSGMLAAGERLERWVYARADQIVTANDAFRRRIEDLAPDGAQVESIPNGTSEAWLAVGGREVDRATLGLPADRFVWAYAGNIGLAHGLEVAVEAAALLGDEYMLLIIGEGPRRAALEAQAKLAGATIALRDLMSAPDAAVHLRAADVLLVSERQERTVSAKLYDLCAVGRPIVAACRGELRRMVEHEGIALAVPHGDPEALAAAVRRLRSDSQLGGHLSNRARAFARDHLREDQARRLAELVEAVAAPA